MKYILLILIFFCCLSFCYAGENVSESPIIVNESVKSVSIEEVVALEDGHLNTSFSDGSKGYCLEYMEQEASVGDVFYKVDTSYAVNNKDNSNVGNYLKLYFTKYNSHAFSDSIVCQHMIWHFTDNFNGWRVNYTIVDEIKNSDEVIGDFYVQRLNSTHERVWLFSVLLSLYEHHQNYFSFVFYDRLIACDGNVSNVTDDGNVSYNSSDYGNISKGDIDRIVLDDDNSTEVYLNDLKSSLNSKVTGFNIFNSLYLLLFGMLIVFFRRK